MNLGTSTSKLNVNSSGIGVGGSGGGSNDNKQQYIPSKIFSQDKIEEKNNIHLSSPPHSTTTPPSLQNQSGSLQTPNTPYSTYFRASGPYQSSSPHHEMNNNTPNLNRRFGYSTTQNLNNSVSGGLNTNNNSDLFSIPVNSIYEEPKQLKQHILQQHQNQQLQNQIQKNAAVQLHRNNLNSLSNYLKTEQPEQQPQPQQQPQQQQTPPGSISQPLFSQDLNQTNYQQQFYNQQQQQQQQQQFYNQQSQYNPQQQQQSPQLQQQNVYNISTNSPFTNIYNQQQQLQQQQLQQSQINPNLGISSSYGGNQNNSANLYVQSVPRSQQQITQIFTEKYDKRWLTVFGFSQDKTDLIIDELSKYANIIEIAYPQQSNCNWVYLKFDSESASADILKKNGLVLGNCMIGIVPYKEIIKSESDPMKPQSLYDNSYNTIEKKYQPARSDYDPQSFSNNALNTPTRPSFFSKVSEYVFGTN